MEVDLYAMLTEIHEDIKAIREALEEDEEIEKEETQKEEKGLKIKKPY